jgi:hypothetical protein
VESADRDRYSRQKHRRTDRWLTRAPPTPSRPAAFAGASTIRMAPTAYRKGSTARSSAMENDPSGREVGNPPTEIETAWALAQGSNGRYASSEIRSPVYWPAVTRDLHRYRGVSVLAIIHLSTGARVWKCLLDGRPFPNMCPAQEHGYGAETVLGDLRELESMRAVLEGVQSAYYVFPIEPGILQGSSCLPPQTGHDFAAPDAIASPPKSRARTQGVRIPVLSHRNKRALL